MGGKSSREDVEPVEEDNREGGDEVGTTAKGGVYGEPREEDFTDYRRHEEYDNW